MNVLGKRQHGVVDTYECAVVTEAIHVTCWRHRQGRGDNEAVTEQLRVAGIVNIYPTHRAFAALVLRHIYSTHRAPNIYSAHRSGKADFGD